MRGSGHINSEALLERQAETYEAKLTALGELLESEKRLALENQAAKYQRKVAQLEDVISDASQKVAELSAEKERLERAMPSHELLADLRAKVRKPRCLIITRCWCTNFEPKGELQGLRFQSAVIN